MLHKEFVRLLQIALGEEGGETAYQLLVLSTVQPTSQRTCIPPIDFSLSLSPSSHGSKVSQIDLCMHVHRSIKKNTHGARRFLRWRVLCFLRLRDPPLPLPPIHPSVLPSDKQTHHCPMVTRKDISLLLLLFLLFTPPR